MSVVIGDRRLGAADVAAVARAGAPVTLAPAAVARLKAARDVLEAWERDDKPVYGLTRGLGNRASETIPPEQRAHFSQAVINARATGAGGYFPAEVSRAALFVRAATLAWGGAGVRREVIDAQIAMLKAGVSPLVPRVGSIGTSDLLLCANLGLPIVGLGRAEYGGEVLAGAEAMRRAGVPTLELIEKEGLALCSSNAVSIGLACLAVRDAWDLLELADAVTAMSYEAFVGNPSPMDARLAEAHPVPGQADAAAALRAMLAGSALFEPGVPRRVQDPISFRCTTHVHGTVRAALAWVEQGLDAELNHPADNPLILIEDEEILSSGNFHTGYLSVALDALRLSLAQLGTASGERGGQLMNAKVSGLPPRLSKHGVTHAGLGLVALLARTVGREVRHASQPVANDDITPFGVEDIAPFTLLGARRLSEQVGWLRQMLVCEMMIAAQALDLRPPPRMAPVAAALHAFVRTHSEMVDDDRSTTEDVEALTAAVAAGAANAAVRQALAG